MSRLGLPAGLPSDLVEPGMMLGTLSNSTTPVIAPASHDTASAVAAISARGNTAFLSSGTWSLVGTELDAPLINADTLRLNFTNEGGANGTTMLLKNVMGLWMLQGCRRAWAEDGDHYEYAGLMDAAAREPGFRSLVDPDHESFLNPDRMPATIEGFCRNTGQPAPESPGAFTRCVLESLALKYRVVIGHLESLTGRAIQQIRVIGGGSKNRLLNQFTADATGRRILAGPAEATALGNIAVQMVSTGCVGSLEEARIIIDHSFPVEMFEPRETAAWDRVAKRFEETS
jgi:rhamnulokinase